MNKVEGKPLIKEGIIKVIARTGGVMFTDQDGFWYNVPKDNQELKDVVMKDFGKGDKIKMEHLNGTFTKIQLIEKASGSQGSAAPVIADEHIMILQGKKFIKHSGLLNAAHSKGLVAIRTDMVHQADDLVIFKAIVEMPGEKLYEAYGDATKLNVNGNILPHMIRMAETRAVNRALRFATNIGMTSAEEMGDSKEETTTQPANAVETKT